MKYLLLLGLLLFAAKSRKAPRPVTEPFEDPPDDQQLAAAASSLGNPLLPMPAEFLPLIVEPVTPYDPMHDWNPPDNPLGTLPGSTLPDWGGDIPLLPTDQITEGQYNAATNNATHLLSQLPGGIRQKISNIQHLASFQRRVFHKIFG